VFTALAVALGAFIFKGRFQALLFIIAGCLLAISSAVVWSEGVGLLEGVNTTTNYYYTSTTNFSIENNTFENGSVIDLTNVSTTTNIVDNTAASQEFTYNTLTSDFVNYAFVVMALFGVGLFFMGIVRLAV